MKKTLLLSVVASTMIMAGGDIAPVEPVVEAPVEVAGWEFSGTAKLYYQTVSEGDVDLFDQDGATANAGVQLRATNNDLFAGVGAGLEVTGLATLGLQNDVVAAPQQLATDDLANITRGGWISQAYLTYGFGNTSIKAGRQELPKSLSPMAYSEDWNVFKNTFDAVLLVNTDIADTTIVAAYVNDFNRVEWGMRGLMQPTFVAMADFDNMKWINDDEGAYMLTLQNKSFQNLTLTGTYYYIPNILDSDEALTTLWGDIAYDAGSFNVAVQGAQVDAGIDGLDATTMFGAKIGTTFGGVNVMAAYSDVNDGDLFVQNLGGSTSALYTDTVLDQLFNGAISMFWGLDNMDNTRWDESKIVVSANTDALGGNIGLTYANYSEAEVNEFDLVYTTNLTDSVNLTAAYVYGDVEDEDLHAVRVVGTYNF